MYLVLLSFPIKGKTKNLNVDYALNVLLNKLGRFPPPSLGNKNQYSIQP